MIMIAFTKESQLIIVSAVLSCIENVILQFMDS